MTSLLKKHTYLVFIFLSLSIAFSTNVIGQLRDNFHEGEYLGFLWHMLRYYQGNAKFPLLVHGGIDYVPSLLAFFVYGEGYAIVGTRIINTLIVAVEWILFLDLCHTLLPRSQRNSYWTVILAGVFLGMAPQLSSDALAVSQDFLGVRTLFLLITMWGIGKHLMSDDRPGAALFLVLGSAGAVVALFWCYDRGLIACAFYGFVLSAMILKRRFGCFAISLSSALLCLLWLEKTRIFGTLGENISDIVYWIRNAAEVNPYPFDKSHLHGYIVVLFLSLVTILNGCAVAAGWDRIKKKENPSGVLLLGLLFVQVLMIKADRSYYSSWPSLIMLFHVGPRLLPLPEIALPSYCSFKARVGDRRSLFLLLVAPTVLFLVLCSNVLWNYAIFARKMIISSPDREVLKPEIALLGEELRKMHADSFLGWTNEGVIAYVAKESICTRYPYAHYVTRFSEADMLEQLKKEPPAAIVFDSAQEAVPAEYRNVPKRLSRVYDFIMTNYRRRKTVNSYVIALR